MTDTANSKSTKRIQISSAPIACPPVAGWSGGRQQPKLTVIPDELPPYYPAALIPQTDLIMCKAVEKFPVQTQIPELCKYVITELRPHFADALRNKVLRHDEAADRMQELIYSLLEYNCDSDSRRDELKNEVKRSAEWLSLAETIVDSRPVDSNQEPSAPNVSAELGRWAEKYLPLLKDFAHHLRAGDPPKDLRFRFTSLFTEVIDPLSPVRQKSFFEKAGGRRLSVPDLLEVLADVKHISGARLADHRKEYRRITGTARPRRSAPQRPV
jgi:hypothetical protein